MIVLLTDGVANRPIGQVHLTVPTAEAIRDERGEIFVIGLGSQIDVGQLHALASSDDHVFLAPGDDDLAEIFEAVADVIVRPAATQLFYVVEPGATPRSAARGLLARLRVRRPRRRSDVLTYCAYNAIITALYAI